MYSLPDEQNKLLKEMGDLDAQERSGIIPVRSNLNLLLLVFSWVIAIIFTIINILAGITDSIQFILIITIVVSIALILSYYNKRVGFYLSAIAFLAANLYGTYASNYQVNAIIVLLDSLVVFVFANQFGKYGFIFGYSIVLAKLIGLFFFNENGKYDELVAQAINIFAIGIIPVLMLSISKVSRKAKKAEIRAQILSLQNQDLIGNWGSMFDQQKPQQIPSTSPENFASNSTLK